MKYLIAYYSLSASNLAGVNYVHVSQNVEMSQDRSFSEFSEPGDFEKSMERNQEEDAAGEPEVIFNCVFFKLLCLTLHLICFEIIHIVGIFYIIVFLEERGINISLN